MSKCIFCGREAIKIKKGQVWKNVETGYELEILDVGLNTLWCKWENGAKGAFNTEKFLEIYRLKK